MIVKLRVPGLGGAAHGVTAVNGNGKMLEQKVSNHPTLTSRDPSPDEDLAHDNITVGAPQPPGADSAAAPVLPQASYAVTAKAESDQKPGFDTTPLYSHAHPTPATNGNGNGKSHTNGFAS